MENRTKSWFRKPFEQEQGNDEIDEVLLENPVPVLDVHHQNGSRKVPDNEGLASNMLDQKETLDSLELDLLVASETLINRRRLELARIQDLQHQLDHLQSKISSNANILNSVEQKSSEYEQIIRNLEKKLTDKQIRFDQLMEDFDTYQINMREDTEKLRFLLSEQNLKYDQLLEEFNKSKKINLTMESQYQEDLRTLKAENSELKTRYDEAQKEKKRLLETFSELTSTLTWPGTDDTTDPVSTTKEPPSRPMKE